MASKRHGIPLSVRIAPDVHGCIIAQAKEAGQSVTNAVERALLLGLEKQREWHVADGRRPGGYEAAVKSRDPVVCFLYLLGRDKLPLGEIETIVQMAISQPGYEFSNDFLAAYAVELAARLRRETAEDALNAAHGALLHG